MAVNPIVEQLKKRKKELEAELKQTNIALNAFVKLGGSVSAPAAKTGVRKPMSAEAREKIRQAQLKRHQPAASTEPTSTEQ